jgi:hypothetical protein
MVRASLFDRFLRIDDRSCALIEAKPNWSRAVQYSNDNTLQRAA